MDTAGLFTLLKNVLRSPEIIGVTVALVFYLNFVFFVTGYRKKKKKVNSIRRRSAAVAQPAAEISPENEPPDIGENTEF